MKHAKCKPHAPAANARPTANAGGRYPCSMHSPCGDLAHACGAHADLVRTREGAHARRHTRERREALTREARAQEALAHASRAGSARQWTEESTPSSSSCSTQGGEHATAPPFDEGPTRTRPPANRKNRTKRTKRSRRSHGRPLRPESGRAYTPAHRGAPRDTPRRTRHPPLGGRATGRYWVSPPPPPVAPQPTPASR